LALNYFGVSTAAFIGSAFGHNSSASAAEPPQAGFAFFRRNSPPLVATVFCGEKMLRLKRPESTSQEWYRLKTPSTALSVDPVASRAFEKLPKLSIQPLLTI
jgi:hypothetical protein